MKRHTLRGRVEPNSVKRLIVDDGRLTHAMKVDEFHVWAISIASGDDPECALGLNYDLGADWDASDNRQIAWAGQTTTGTTRLMTFELIDKEHLVNQDLYISNFSAHPANYLITLTAVTLSDDQAILTLIKEASQSVTR